MPGWFCATDIRFLCFHLSSLPVRWRRLGVSRHDQSLEEIKPKLKVGISAFHSSCDGAVGSNGGGIIAIHLDCKRNRCIAIDIAQRCDVSL